MPIHLPFHIPRIPDFLKRPLDPSQTLEAFEHYAEKAIDFATRHGGEIGRNIMDDLVDAAAPYAAFLDTTVDAFLPGINLFYGEKWASRQGRKDPFKQKGGVVKRKSSQSPARRMSKRPRQDYNDFIRQQDRDIRRRLGSGMPKIKGNVSLAGRHYKSRARRPSDKTKFIKRVYDDRISEARDYALWMCVNTHGSDTRAMDIAAAAAARAMLATIGVHPASWDEALHVPQDSRNLYIRYRRVEIGSGANQVSWGGPINLHNRSFGAVAEDISDQFLDFADNRNSPGAPTITDKGYFPFAFQFEGPDIIDAVGTSVNQFGTGSIRDLSIAKITLRCTQILRIQNVTPNDAGGIDTTQADRNPIRGKVYYADNRFPRVKDAILEHHSDYTAFHNNGAGSGVWGGPAMAVADPIQHPPHPKALFKNCSKVQDVYLGLGANQVFKTYFTKTYTLGKFCELVANVHDTKNFGGSMTFGLEQANRSTATAPVSITCNRELHMSAHCQLKRKKHMIQDYATTSVTI